MLWAAVGIVGFIILLSSKSPWLSYAGATIAQLGAATPSPTILTWIGNNVAGDMKRGDSPYLKCRVRFSNA